MHAICTYLFYHFRKSLFDTQEDPDYNPLPEERPGGFNWGEGQRVGEQDAGDRQG